MDQISITPVDDGWVVVGVAVDLMGMLEPSVETLPVLAEAMMVIEEAWHAENRALRRHEVTCQRCGRTFTAVNAARFCGGTCRVAAHRARHRTT